MAEPLRLLVLSTSRSDFDLLAPVVRAARARPEFAVTLVACGAHHRTGTPAPAALAALGGALLPAPRDSLGLVHQPGLLRVARDAGCEIALVLGDRLELLEACAPLLAARIAIAHCSGGERTLGAVDDQVRDAVTRLAHLHLPAHEPAAARLRELGEEPWRIAVAGEPGLDGLRERVADDAAVRERLGFAPRSGDAVVAVHPVTRDPDETGRIIAAVAALAGAWAGRLLLSTPNGDPGSERIAAAWADLAGASRRCHALPEGGAAFFRAVVARCGLIIGNSSAGLVEAPSLGATTVDVGSRQAGRVRGASVVSCPVTEVAALDAAIRAARRPEAVAAASPLRNPYGDGQAVPRILAHLAAHARRAGLQVKA